MTRATVLASLGLSLRAALAAWIALLMAQLVPLQHPIYAMIGAVIVTDVTAAKTRKLSLPRLVGTVLGASMGALIDSFMKESLWTVGFGILLAMFMTQLLSLPDAAKVAGYVCGIVVLNYRGNPWSYALYRTGETVLGIAAAVLMSVVPKLISIEESKPPDKSVT